jgi:hypothetical protein
MTIEFKEVPNLDPAHWECGYCLSAARDMYQPTDGDLSDVVEDARTHDFLYPNHDIIVYMREGAEISQPPAISGEHIVYTPQEEPKKKKKGLFGFDTSFWG